MAYKYIKRHIPIRAITLSLTDVKRIYERLSKHLEDEADRQTNELKKPDDQSAEEFATQIAKARKNAFRITVTVSGADGQDLYGDTVELFDSANMPDEVAYIFMTNQTAYKGETGRKPPNCFDFALDFAKPPLVDNNNPVSNPTANGSNISIEGDRDAWVAAISDATMGILEKRKNGRTFLHAAFVYDIGLMLFAMPFGLYLCWRLSSIVDTHFGSRSPFLTGVTYVYIMLLGFWLYRLLFGYTKWAFPCVELSDSRSKSTSHRNLWYVLITSIASGAAIEIWKYFAAWPA